MAKKYIKKLSLLAGLFFFFAYSQTFAGFLFSKNLRLGDKGIDVLELQKILNSDKETLIAVEGPGSAGNETEYFGNLTKEAVKRFQKKYSKDVLAPAGLSEPTGFVGSLTRTKLNDISFSNDTENLEVLNTDKPFEPEVIGSFISGVSLNDEQKTQVEKLSNNLGLQNFLENASISEEDVAKKGEGAVFDYLRKLNNIQGLDQPTVEVIEQEIRKNGKLIKSDRDLIETLSFNGRKTVINLDNQISEFENLFAGVFNKLSFKSEYKLFKENKDFKSLLIKDTDEEVQKSIVDLSNELASKVPTPQSLSYAITKPFGGRNYYTYACTCSPPYLQLIIVGPGSGNYNYGPSAYAFTRSQWNVGQTGPQFLGNARGPSVSCWFYVPPSECFPIPAVGDILIVGSSLY